VEYNLSERVEMTAMNGKIIFLLSAVVIATLFVIQTGGGEQPVDRGAGLRPELSDDSEKSGSQFRGRHPAVKDTVIIEPARSGNGEKLDYLTEANREGGGIYRQGVGGQASVARIAKMKKIFFLILTLSEKK
jgi:hypothetical protein